VSTGVYGVRNPVTDQLLTSSICSEYLPKTPLTSVSVHSFTHSVNLFSSTHYALGTVLEAEDTAQNKADKIPAPNLLYFNVADRKISATS
jgi:hypothetical protein